ncbi:RNA-directed DNA polymerase, eukaryota, reverse transcriptase zinc-binding domain protein [Tanacetum coccineum]|uniref:RNA-directed DNA polymerase, eukaryota, reverse transcriptase zinc-binding domain protein n=1 Tax=Tanacetum coccineum TaxID=301880 RepID=A0ABQ5IZT6_9ASTR
MLKGRSQRNRIQVIYDADGQRYEGDQVSFQFVNHFKNFLGINAPVSSIDAYEDLFTTKLSPYEASQMIKPITDNEIKKAMFSIADNKAPGPDGFSAKFFKAAWHIVGSDVCSAVKEFFSSGKLLGELNATIISLIPKITTPMLVTDFRPIACCNVVYKCINLIQGYNRVGGPKRVAFKIDIHKAYDTVSWDFMEQLLKHFDFNEKMRNWIMNVKNNPEFNYHFGCKDLKITHICFADDLMMFCHGDSVLVKVIKDPIKEFGNLPVRYLGVPLISKRIGIKDCDTLWVKWVSTVKLKGVSIWVVQKEECDSWGWKNLLTIRDLIINHVLFKIANGEDTFMWYDNWSGLGPLINNTSHRIMYNARLQKESNVADMIADGSWINGSEWVNSVGLSTIPVPMIKQGEKDKIMWLDNSGNPTKFTMCKVYDDLRCHCEDVNWSKLVWFSQCIPKHSFILWLAVQERLLTQDRLKMWGSYDMMVCGLCMMDEESHNHLFFQCEYSKAIWKKLQLMMGSNISSQCWKDTVEFMSNKPCFNNIWSIIRRLCLGASVYFIWQERNFRLFRDQKRDWKCLLNIVCDTIRARLMGLTVKNSIEVNKAAAVWDVNGFVSNILESSGCDCTLLVVFSVLLGLGRELDWIDERERLDTIEGGCFLANDAIPSCFLVLFGEVNLLNWLSEYWNGNVYGCGAHKVKNEALFSVLLGWKMLPSQACPISVLAEECFPILCISTCSMLLNRILL